jgi:tRNA pseudouridine13 synthase
MEFAQSSGAPLSLEPPWLVPSVAGIGGTIRSSPEDFEVEEIAAYEPCGAGDHLFLWIEKRGVAADDLIRHVAAALGVASGDVGVAGLKDRHALTRQWVSVPRAAEPRVPAIDADGIRVLAAQPHANKLRTGHLAGNRFRIVVRGVAPDAAALAEQVRSVLLETGLANFFGPQRFGRGGETAELGLRLLRGEPVHGRLSRFLRKLALSAGQAVLFNRCLSRRIEDGLLRTVLSGDVMFKKTGGIFYVTDRACEQQRFDRGETVHAGPIFGKKMFAARDDAATREAAVMEEFGIAPSRLRAFGGLLLGTRRENLVSVADLRITPHAGALEFSFSLPAGCYATVLLREFMKQPCL